MPKSVADFVEYHAVMAGGYNDQTGEISFINNWGLQWGENGFGTIPYEYFEKYVSDAWMMKLPMGHFLPKFEGDPFCNSVRLFHYLDHLRGAVDLWDMVNDVRVGWCYFRVSEKRIEIEDFFVRPEYELYHPGYLFSAMAKIRRDLNLPLRLWIAHADTRSKSVNFRIINSLIRAAHLNVRKSPFPWAAYVCDES